MSILVFLNGCCLNGSAFHEILVENGSLEPLTILYRKKQVMGPVSQILAVLRFNKNSLVMFLFLGFFFKTGDFLCSSNGLKQNSSASQVLRLQLYTIVFT